MALVLTLNRWGRVGGLEPQRADLWVANMETVVNAVRVAFPKLSLPDYMTSGFYARQVVFPDVSVATYEAKRHSVPVLYPGYDEPIGQVRIDFLVEAGKVDVDGTLAPQVNSRIFNLIKMWHQMARVGRPSRSSSDDAITIPLGTVPAPLSAYFRFDIRLDLYTGVDTDISMDMNDVQVNGMRPTTRLILRRAWVQNYMLGGLDQEMHGFMKLTAALAVEEISPDTSGTT